MGVAKDAAYEMSTGAVELAADMASFYNLEHEDALNKIKSGLVGEAEPLKQLGILVDEATIKTAAYEGGIASFGSELSATQKVQARWLAIQNQTIKAQGDLARTIESPSNAIKLMRGQIVQASIDLSVSLLPAFEIVVDVLSEFADALIEGSKQTSAWLEAWLEQGGLETIEAYLFALRDGVFAAVDAVKNGIAFFIRWKDVLVALGTGIVLVATGWGIYTTAIWLSTTATAAWGAAVALATGGLTLLIPALLAGIALLVAGWVLWGDAIKDWLAGVGNKFIGWFNTAVETLRPFAAVLGLDLPDALVRFETAASEVTVELTDMQAGWESLSAAQQAANEDQYTAELIRQAAAGALLTTEQRALVRAQKDGAVSIAALRAGWESLDAEGQAANMRGYVTSLEEAEAQGYKLTIQEWDLVEASHAAAGALSTDSSSVSQAAADMTIELVDLTGALQDFGLIAKQTPPPIHDIGTELEWLRTRFDQITQIPIDDFMVDLGVVTEASGLQFDALAGNIDEAEDSSGKLDVTLAALAGQMGGADGARASTSRNGDACNRTMRLKRGRKGFTRKLKWGQPRC